MISNNNNLQIAMIMNVHSHTRIVMWQFIQNIHKYELFSKTAISFNAIRGSSFFPFHYPSFPNFHFNNNSRKQFHQAHYFLPFSVLTTNFPFSKHTFKYPIFLHTFPKSHNGILVYSQYIHIYTCMPLIERR